MKDIHYIFKILKDMEDRIFSGIDTTNEYDCNILEYLYCQSEYIKEKVCKIIENKINDDILLTRSTYTVFTGYLNENIELNSIKSLTNIGYTTLDALEKLFILEEHKKLPDDISYNQANKEFLADLYAKIMSSIELYKDVENYEKRKLRLLDFCDKTQVDEHTIDCIKKYHIDLIETLIVEKFLNAIEMMQDSVGFTLEDIENALEICERYAPDNVKVLKLRNDILGSKLGIDNI